MRRLTAAIAAAVLVLFGCVALAGGASAAPGNVTITAPGEDGEDTTPLIEGTADAGVEVHVIVASDEVDVVTADDDGSWTYQLTSPLPQDTSTSIRAEVQDEDGGVVGSAEQQYYVWPERSTLTILSPTNGQVVGPTFQVKTKVVGDPNRLEYFTVLVDNEGATDEFGFGDFEAGIFTSTVTPKNLRDGTHSVSIVATDVYGRSIRSQVATFTADVTPPEQPVLTSPAAGSTVTTKQFTFRGTGTPGDTVEVVFDRSGEPVSDRVVVRADGTFAAPVYASAKPPFNPFDGLGQTQRAYGFRLVETDAVGNHNSTGFALTIDLRPATSTPSPAPSSPTPADPTGSGSAPTGASGSGSTPASAVPAVDGGAELANTGPSTVPGTAVALLLIAFGLVLVRASRRLTPAVR